LALTRPIALALVPVVVAHWLARHRCQGRDSFTPADRWRVGLLVPWCAAVTDLWPLIAAVATHDSSAYLQTMAAWKSYRANTPVLSWLGYFWRGAGWPDCCCALSYLRCSPWSYDGRLPGYGARR
jgi:hypothetical protein